MNKNEMVFPHPVLKYSPFQKEIHALLLVQWDVVEKDFLNMKSCFTTTFDGPMRLASRDYHASLKYLNIIEVPFNYLASKSWLSITLDSP